MVKKRFADEQVARLDPIVDKLLTMMGAARVAFNRHSRISLEELRNLQSMVAMESSDMGKQLKGLIAQKSEEEKPVFVKFHSILNHLEMIGDNIGGFADPIEKKIRNAVLFSDKAVTQTNFLFDQHSGLIRSVLDIIKTDNEFLKKYVLEEGRKLVQACIDFATEHEERMIEGLCLPQAAPIFLAILERMRGVSQHEMEITAILAKKD
ncbi:MAG: hypothetical protein M0P73_11520 [Syntrophobacterales bacterium]|jgi:Na+/phosphate symporter|nr:hypothetical protein [Syntrophobacterales bacterium]